MLEMLFVIIVKSSLFLVLLVKVLGLLKAVFKTSKLKQTFYSVLSLVFFLNYSMWVFCYLCLKCYLGYVSPPFFVLLVEVLGFVVVKAVSLEMFFLKPVS